MPYTPSVYSRHSRFGLSSWKPQDLAAIIRQLVAAKKRRGAFSDRNQLRAAIARARSKLDVPRDDVVRFLLNEQIVIDHDDGRYYYDPDRAQAILDCVTRGTTTAPPAPKNARVAAIIAANDGSPKEAPAIGAALAGSRPKADPETAALSLDEQALDVKRTIALLRAQFSGH